MWDLIVSVPDHCLSFYFTFNILYPPISRFVVIGAFPPTTCCNFTILFSLPAIRGRNHYSQPLNLLLAILSSARRDLPSVFDANCSLSIFRSLFTLLIDSAILILSAICVFTSSPAVSSLVCRFV